MVASVFVVVFIILLIAGIPVVFSLGMTSFVSAIVMWGVEGLPLDVLAQRMTSGFNSFTTVGIPLFLLAGKLMNAGTISHRIFKFAQDLVGRFPGGLGHVNVLASVIFSGMSGSVAADAAGLGQIEIQAMVREGFDVDFSAGITGASALISPIIPPSVPMVTYAILAGTSVSAMFIGGIVPGLLMAAGLCIMVAIYAKKRNYPKSPAPSRAEVWHDFKRAILPLMTPVIIIGGIWTGWFTPTEAAAIAVLYSAILILFVYRSLTLKAFWAELRKSMVDCACIMFVMGGINMYGYMLTRTRIPLMLANWIVTITDDPALILTMLIVFLLIIGCFMSTLESIMLFTPIFIPILSAINYDPMTFGVVMCVTLMIGQLTPPFGTTLFVLTKITNMSMDRVVKACLPFAIPILIVVALLVVFPPLVTFLPSLVLGT